jgi:peptidoglycan/LPS O-acetylase OafA/YrhL
MRPTESLPWVIPKRLYLLDCLRGIAALSVVLFHWHHFYLPYNHEGIPYVGEQQPFFDQLSFIYLNGGGAVNLFFCLSGFVFFWLYEKQITDGTTSFIEFSLLRFSRLYPLHLTTLLLVAFGQSDYVRLTNTAFVFKFNDAYHFLLNLAFASAWGFDQVLSFNGPVWSVSIEVLLYGIFFVVCRQGITRVAMLFGLSFGVGGVVSTFNLPLGNGLACFFIGGLAFRAYAVLVKNKFNDQALVVALILASMAWLLTILGIGDTPRFETKKYDFVPRLFPIYVLYPLTLIAAALAETRWKCGKRFSFLGDISYSVYLIHFPLQLAVVILVIRMKLHPTMFYSPIFFVLFLTVLILLSFASHKYLEMPAQRWIRANFAERGRRLCRFMDFRTKRLAEK